MRKTPSTKKTKSRTAPLGQDQCDVLVMALSTIFCGALCDCSQNDFQPEDWSRDIDERNGVFADIFSFSKGVLTFIIHLDDADNNYEVMEHHQDTMLNTRDKTTLNKKELNRLVAELEQSSRLGNFINQVSGIATSHRDSGFNDFLQKLSEKS